MTAATSSGPPQPSASLDRDLERLSTISAISALGASPFAEPSRLPVAGGMVRPSSSVPSLQRPVVKVDGRPGTAITHKQMPATRLNEHDSRLVLGPDFRMPLHLDLQPVKSSPVSLLLGHSAAYAPSKKGNHRVACLNKAASSTGKAVRGDLPPPHGDSAAASLAHRTQSPSAVSAMLDQSISEGVRALGVREGGSSPKQDQRIGRASERRQASSQAALASLSGETAEAFIVRSAASSRNGAGSPFAARSKEVGPA